MIRVRVVRRRGAVPVADLTLRMLSMHGESLAVAKTDERGVVAFVAPEVEHPSDVLFEPQESACTTYLYGNDPRARMLGLEHGCHQIAFTTILPQLVEAPTPVAAAVRFEVAQGVGWWDGVAFPALIEKARRRGWIADDSWWITKGNMEDQFGHKGSGDMWTFFGHSYFDHAAGRTGGVRAWRPFGAVIRGTIVTVKDLCAAAKRGQGPPGFVVLGGCSTDELLEELVDCCVKVAVGVTAPISPPIMQRTLMIFWEALFDGKAFGAAMTEANAYLGAHLWNSTGALLTFRTKAHLRGVGGMTLDQIREAARAE
ncbi:MAG TPA: hypothetical protein PKC43_12055 [Phycisphaerales bacterium]|nr:hypothetical protein [Phycisphaerales bacterium]